MDFSQYQVAKLMKQSKLTQKIKDVRKDMNLRNVGEIASSLTGEQAAEVIQSQRVVSEDASHYILIKGLNKNKHSKDAPQSDKPKSEEASASDSKEQAVDVLQIDSDSDEELLQAATMLEGISTAHDIMANTKKPRITINDMCCADSSKNAVSLIDWGKVDIPKASAKNKKEVINIEDYEASMSYSGLNKDSVVTFDDDVVTFDDDVVMVKEKKGHTTADLIDLSNEGGFIGEDSSNQERKMEYQRKNKEYIKTSSFDDVVDASNNGTGTNELNRDIQCQVISASDKTGDILSISKNNGKTIDSQVCLEIDSDSENEVDGARSQQSEVMLVNSPGKAIVKSSLNDPLENTSLELEVEKKSSAHPPQLVQEDDDTDGKFHTKQCIHIFTCHKGFHSQPKFQPKLIGSNLKLTYNGKIYNIFAMSLLYQFSMSVFTKSFFLQHLFSDQCLTSLHNIVCLAHNE